MAIFERYLLKKLLVSLAAIVPILLLIITVRLLVRLLDRVAINVYPVDVLMPLLAIGILNALVYILPFSAMFATVLVLRKSYYNNEMYAAFTLHISRQRIYFVLMSFGIPLALFLFYMMVEAIPNLNYQYKLIKEQSKEHSGLSMIPSGQFIQSDDGTVLFIEQRDDDRIKGIFLSNANGSFVETAPFGQRVKSGKRDNIFELFDGRVYQKEPDDGGYALFSYRAHQVWVPQKQIDVRLKPSMLGFSSLLKQDSLAASAELQRRLAIPISLLLLLLLAESLGRTQPRQSNYLRPIASIIIFLLYANMISVSAKMVADGRLAVYPGVWIVPITLLLATLLWLAYQRRYQLL